mmetsp:Transcript_13039/g.35520  ORF Transcript_13039/g.35520 Transcript_13039/m.35520 type:complete len:343 (-) Transcript_13039:145-1173(-)|eukprot:CAMPEP_0202388414 /NCGR_PEP_ID=MMETSP1127-20130417/77359_1 /ASSEMBLY_ACC=CAM_ASM_000462 /TAXON_ID=3047 /ORGANISM="Dunaliella tertiolecta, Strain CCMP1320" /LENGTH=342 /DNA_ID=CAMNT_0048989825 /DNA_START=47 /DNA_END=1075 /DNA_ORIENTATION=-
MGKGLNKRKRAKHVEAARDGNLHKAQWGKASGNLLPPKAPSKQDFVEHIPASLRRMMAAKALAEEQEAKKRERKDGVQSQKAHDPQDHEPQQQPSMSAKAGNRQAATAAVPTEQGSEPSTSGRTEGPKLSSKPSQAEPPAHPKVFKLNAFDQAPEKKGSKEKKKAYYKKREEKKKAKKLKGKPEAELTPAELKLRAQQVATQASFGETANAPLKVQLKRKHWTGGDANQGERLAKIQRAQLSHAEQRAAEQLKGPGKADKGDKVPAAKKRKAEPAAASGGVGLLHKARMQQAAIEKAEAREAVVQAYRQSKKQHSTGSATMASLGKLAAQGAERLKQQQQME